MVVLFHMPLISQNYDVEIENGIKLIQSDRYDSAIIIFDNVLLNDSNNIIALFWKSYALEYLNKDDDALKCYNKILEINPDFLPAKVYKCSLEYKDKNKKVENCYKKAIAIKPNDYLDYIAHGLANFYLKNYDDALYNYNKAIELNPDFAYSYLLLANLYFEKGDYDLALENYNKTNELNPDYIRAYFMKAYICHEKNQYDESIKNYKKIIEINDTITNSYLLITII
jgi:tetratricopeptide (TPR) repeat protein